MLFGRKIMKHNLSIRWVDINHPQLTNKTLTLVDEVLTDNSSN